MDQDIEELKKLVQKNIELTQDTNRLVRKLRRGAMWSMLLTVLWWIFIIVGSSAAYYYYLQPYITKIEQDYGSAQNFESQMQNLFESATKSLPQGQ